jgi:PAS domain S-box-containing protein
LKNGTNRAARPGADEFSTLLLMGKSAISKLPVSENQLESYFSRVIGQATIPHDFRDPYQILVDNLPHKVFLKNLDSVYIDCNSQLSEYLGIKRSDIVGKTDSDFFPEAVALQDRYEDQLTLEQGLPRIYVQEFSKNDQKFLFQITKIPLQDSSGKNHGILGILVEMNDTVTFREIFGHDGRQASLLVENNRDVYYKLDFYGLENYVSSDIVRLTGYTADEQMKLSHGEMVDPASLRDLEELMGFYKKASERQLAGMDRTKFYRTVDLLLRKKDGGTVWVESMNNLYFTSTGEVRGIIGMYRNINERKMLGAQLQATLEKSSQLSQTQAQIISTISHEFKTPISILQSNLQLIAQQRNKLDDACLDEIFDLSIEAVKALNSTLVNISFLAKNQKGAFRLATQKINLHQYIKKIVRELTCIPEYSNRIVCSVEVIRMHFMIDPTLMRHVLVNLLINGLNYSPQSCKVSLGVEEQGNDLRFAVRDNGIGIPAEDLDRIFESFYRAGNVADIKGSGLGLAIVKECVTLQSGKISIDSEPGRGTEVEVIIPFENG